MSYHSLVSRREIVIAGEISNWREIQVCWNTGNSGLFTLGSDYMGEFILQKFVQLYKYDFSIFLYYAIIKN